MGCSGVTLTWARPTFQVAAGPTLSWTRPSASGVAGRRPNRRSTRPRTGTHLHDRNRSVLHRIMADTSRKAPERPFAETPYECRAGGPVSQGPSPQIPRALALSPAGVPQARGGAVRLHPG